MRIPAQTAKAKEHTVAMIQDMYSPKKRQPKKRKAVHIEDAWKEDTWR